MLKLNIRNPPVRLPGWCVIQQCCSAREKESGLEFLGGCLFSFLASVPHIGILLIVILGIAVWGFNTEAVLCWLWKCWTWGFLCWAAWLSMWQLIRPSRAAMSISRLASVMLWDLEGSRVCSRMFMWTSVKQPFCTCLKPDFGLPLLLRW